MSSSSNSVPGNHDNPSTKMCYDVFMNFRGVDTRRGFAGHLRAALRYNYISTFFDDKDLTRGRTIWEGLQKAIEGSRCSVVIFSENYASSSWCLRELVTIVRCMNTTGQTVLPIFYHVDPSHVRKLTGSFAEVLLQKHEQNHEDELQNWRQALTEVGERAGWHLDGREIEADCIERVVEQLVKTLKDRPEEQNVTKTLKDRPEEQNATKTLKDRPEEQNVTKTLKDRLEEKNATNPIIGKAKSVLSDPISEGGCLELANEEMGTGAFKYLMANLQDRSRRTKTLSAIAFESTISSWFKKRSSEPSISTRLEPNRWKEWRGLAVCVCFSPYPLNTLTSTLSLNGRHIGNKTHQCHKKCQKSDIFRIWIMYISHDDFPNRNIAGNFEISFHNELLDDNWCFGPIGVRLVYQKDIEELQQMSSRQGSYERHIEADFIESMVQELVKTRKDRPEEQNVTKDIKYRPEERNVTKTLKDRPEERNATNPIIGKGKSVLSDPISKGGCLELAKEEIGTEAFKYLKANLQDRSRRTKSWYYIAYESTISSWFKKRSSEPSISTRLEPNRCKEWRGLAVCVCFRPYPLNILTSTVRLNGHHIANGNHQCHQKCQKSDIFRIWIMYISHDDFPNRNIAGNFEISFHNELLDDKWCFGPIGVRLVYQKDIEELQQMSSRQGSDERDSVRNFIQDDSKKMKDKSKEKNIGRTGKGNSFSSEAHSSKMLNPSDEFDDEESDDENFHVEYSFQLGSNRQCNKESSNKRYFEKNKSPIAKNSLKEKNSHRNSKGKSFLSEPRSSKVLDPSDDEKSEDDEYEDEDSFHLARQGTKTGELILKTNLQTSKLLQTHLQAFKLVKTLLDQNPRGPIKSSSVVVLEEKISSWFIKQSSEASINMKVERNWCTSDWKGWLICVCFLPSSNTLSCKLRVENSDILVGRHRSRINSNSSRIWMIYLSRDDWPTRFLRNIFGNIEISFHDESLDDSRFGPCGVRLIYKQDTKDFNQNIKVQ